MSLRLLISMVDVRRSTFDVRLPAEGIWFLATHYLFRGTCGGLNLDPRTRPTPTGSFCNRFYL